MATITAAGAINTTALIVPGLYVQIVSPTVANLNGVPTNVMGIVGTAHWGPVNVPTVFGTMAEYYTAFGPVATDAYDMGTIAAPAVQQGANTFVGVRVTDGTEIKASVTQGTEITFTALYPGSLGNQISVTQVAASVPGLWNVQIGLPGVGTENFTNIGGSGNAFWVNLANAVNNGQNFSRGASKLVSAVAGASTAAPVAGYTLLAGGTDGASSISDSDLIGVDTSPRKGVYALRKQNVSIGVVAGPGDTTIISAITPLGLSEGIYFVTTGAAGETFTTAISNAQAASSYAVKYMIGDFVYWYDAANVLTRAVPPTGFVAGRLANLAPNQSSLNKQLFGVIGTVRGGLPNTGQSLGYTSADLQQLLGGGVDCIANPSPGGNYYAVQGGINSSLNEDVNGDNYTQMTNYIASTLASGMGIYIGQVITPTLLSNIRATLLNFLGNMLQQTLLAPQISKFANSSANQVALPYSVVCDASNNPLSRTSLGYVQADVQVQYEAINKFFIVNLEGGQTVSVATS